MCRAAKRAASLLLIIAISSTLEHVKKTVHCATASFSEPKGFLVKILF